MISSTPVPSATSNVKMLLFAKAAHPSGLHGQLRPHQHGVAILSLTDFLWRTKIPVIRRKMIEQVFHRAYFQVFQQPGRFGANFLSAVTPACSVVIIPCLKKKGELLSPPPESMLFHRDDIVINRLTARIKLDIQIAILLRHLSYQRLRFLSSVSAPE